MTTVRQLDYMRVLATAMSFGMKKKAVSKIVTEILNGGSDHLRPTPEQLSQRLAREFFRNKANHRPALTVIEGQGNDDLTELMEEAA